jgi:hypothetical protein
MFDIPIKNMVSFFYSYVKLPEASDGFSHWEVPHWKTKVFLFLEILEKNWNLARTEWTCLADDA